MWTKLFELIKRQIEVNGPLTIAAYMELCLSHPEFGYYQNRDPLGVAGDFITAPEVSQLFGEMIGFFVADVAMKLESKNIILCELGPGRGTLIKDVLRVVSKMPDARFEVHLVETSPVLIQTQKENIPQAVWHTTLETVPDNHPVIFIANEFFDALPIRQAVKTKRGWQEHVIGLENGQLIFGLGNEVQGTDLPDAPDHSIFEFSPMRESIWLDICERVKRQRGAALVIDYGHLETKIGGTFQAVKNHVYANVLDKPGEQDLTSHVDFAKLRDLAKGLEIPIYTSQEDFLVNMGIEVRAEKLSEVNPDWKDTIRSGLRRLIHRDEMGSLFKAIGILNV